MLNSNVRIGTIVKTKVERNNKTKYLYLFVDRYKKNGFQGYYVINSPPKSKLLFKLRDNCFVLHIKTTVPFDSYLETIETLSKETIDAIRHITQQFRVKRMKVHFYSSTTKPIPKSITSIVSGGRVSPK